ncbi:hypothetical protein Hanom_Chr03g00190311 [Helianthus anomalus]
MSRSCSQTITNKWCRQVRIVLAVEVLIMFLYFYYLEVVILTLVLFSWLNWAVMGQIKNWGVVSILLSFFFQQKL